MTCVKYVVVFDDDTPHKLLHALRPDVLVKGGTYTADRVVGHEVVEAYGGTVCVTGLVDGISTTSILASLARGETSRAGEPTSPMEMKTTEAAAGDATHRMRRAG
jgi:bifunctional ADP-heptose synthase (sugar kinase/adenylyltransferase)